MRKIAFLQLVLLIVICFILAGCSPKYPHADTLVPVSTYTALPTLTITPISTPTFIATPTLFQATPVNTMTFEEQKDFVKEFMSNSGDCRLPCWWSISPGQTWEDAEKRIHNLNGSLIEVFPGYDSETIVYIIGIKDTSPIDNLHLEKKQGIVYAWHVLDTGGVIDPDRFGRNWKNYSVQKIMNRYGEPNRILLNSSPSYNSQAYGIYYLWLFYDKIGFSILYNSRIPRHFSNLAYFDICPGTDPLLNIELNMQSPDNPLPLDRFDQTLEDVRISTEIGKLIVVRSFQEATGLSNEEIYQTFMHEKDPCFAIPSDIWMGNSTP
ncbi:MAG: hypothetical protein J0L96_03685 [Anaerolineae bacterium]|nr:hypothetical protein [Anaerolineae bacterium]